MAVCTFFGHRNCAEPIGEKLQTVLEDLVINHGVDLFYVGKEGQFDAMVHQVLRSLKRKYPYIQYAVVLAYLPPQGTTEDYWDTMLPEGIEAIHPRYAISWRNRWMLQRSDYVVTYITHPWGGAAKFAEIARRQHKVLINLAAE